MPKNCTRCGGPTDGITENCKYCGERLPVSAAMNRTSVAPVAKPAMQTYTYHIDPNVNPSLPLKSKTVAGLLGIFLGGFGIHKFYLGRTRRGIVYLLFFWTYIPAYIGFIEGLIYLLQNEHNFQVKNKVRTR